MEKREPSYAVCGNVNWYNHCKKAIWKFLKKLNIEFLYDSAIPFLGIYLENMNIPVRKDTSTKFIHCSAIYNSQDMEAT